MNLATAFFIILADDYIRNFQVSKPTIFFSFFVARDWYIVFLYTKMLSFFLRLSKYIHKIIKQCSKLMNTTCCIKRRQGKVTLQDEDQRLLNYARRRITGEREIRMISVPEDLAR